MKGDYLIMTINIVDAPCGTGKTSAAINYMNANKEDRFLYITPYLKEVERIKENCPGFREPQKYGTKMNGIKYLLEKGENIVSTHALFESFNENLCEVIQAYNYTLIMDEVTEVVRKLEITEDDANTILEKYAIVDEETHLLKWVAKDYEGRFNDYKTLCDLECIVAYGSGDKKILLLWLFPVSVFKAFHRIYILTYIFEAQTQFYYYNMYDCDYVDLWVKQENGQFFFTGEQQNYDLSYLKDLVHILNNEKMNYIGNLDHALSKSWYDKHKDTALTNKIKSNCHNLFINITKTPVKQNMWTTFKDYQNKIKGKGYSKGFVSLNARATNIYREKTVVAYLVNVYMNPIYKNYFLLNGVEVNEDLYALSELIQFIFRSAIRDKKEIQLYIPSKRMRTLLQNWIDEVTNKEEK